MPDALEAIAAAEAELAANYGAGEREVLLSTIDAVQSALTTTGIDHVWIGGIASAVYGRPRVSHDVDVMVRPCDARRLLQQLHDDGFDTEERAPHWLFKAYKPGQEIDIIFNSIPNVYLDAAMLAHAQVHTFEGRSLQLISPEDLVVIKAAAAAEHSPRHWHDALGILSSWPLDWDYFLERARLSPRRVLSLLWYFVSGDHAIPRHVLRTLNDMVLDDG